MSGNPWIRKGAVGSSTGINGSDIPSPLPHDLAGKPYVTVTADPWGTADFGPYTPGTQTSGVQEALIFASEQGMAVYLFSGVYNCYATITLPSSCKLIGEYSGFGPSNSWGGLQGVVIYMIAGGVDAFHFNTTTPIANSSTFVNSYNAWVWVENIGVYFAQTNTGHGFYLPALSTTIWSMNFSRFYNVSVVNHQASKFAFYMENYQFCDFVYLHSIGGCVFHTKMTINLGNSYFNHVYGSFTDPGSGTYNIMEFVAPTTSVNQCLLDHIQLGVSLHAGTTSTIIGLYAQNLTNFQFNNFDYEENNATTGLYLTGCANVVFVNPQWYSSETGTVTGCGGVVFCGGNLFFQTFTDNSTSNLYLGVDFTQSGGIAIQSKMVNCRRPSVSPLPTNPPVVSTEYQNLAGADYLFMIPVTNQGGGTNNFFLGVGATSGGETDLPTLTYASTEPSGTCIVYSAVVPNGYYFKWGGNGVTVGTVYAQQI